MKKKPPLSETISLDKIVGGGQALGTLADGRKAFVWGGLPGETVTIQTTKIKNKYVEAIISQVDKPSSERVEPRDPASYLSTSPWQIMSFSSEQHYKSALIEEAFELHDIVLPSPIGVYTDKKEYGYRNKVEFSWWWDNDTNELDLAFFMRGGKGKVPVQGTALAIPVINELAIQIRDCLRTKQVEARSLKTLIVRSDQNGNCVWQLYVKDKLKDLISPDEAATFSAQGGEIIYSDPKSPASQITKKLVSFGELALTDTILDIPFHYSAESFFQGNVPVYEQALRDMKPWVGEGEIVDMYSGVGTIGLTIGGTQPTMVEISEPAVREMKRNITELKSKAGVVLASSESAVEYITADTTVIVDPPRAGLHSKVVDRLLEVKPPRIIYLSCNPVTQARDVALLSEIYGIRHHQGYNFFPRTPHIEHLVVLDKR